VAWGANEEGQYDAPLPNTDFIAIAAGWGHVLGLKNDGSIRAWGGTNYYGQCTVPSPNTGFTAIAAGKNHSLGLKGEQGEPVEPNDCLYYLAGDLNDDCKVNFFDFAILAGSWMSNNGDLKWNSICDISEPKDSIINWKDLAVLCESWLIDCNTDPLDPACI